MRVLSEVLRCPDGTVPLPVDIRRASRHASCAFALPARVAFDCAALFAFFARLMATLMRGRW